MSPERHGLGKMLTPSMKAKPLLFGFGYNIIYVAIPPPCSPYAIGRSLARSLQYHAVQLLEGLCPNGKLVAVVEPWFLGAGAESKPGIEFKEWSEAVVSKHPDVEFRASLADVSPSETGRRMALISGRTADNPRLLTECIAQGINTVYLEVRVATTYCTYYRKIYESASAATARKGTTRALTLACRHRLETWRSNRERA